MNGDNEMTEPRETAPDPTWQALGGTWRLKLSGNDTSGACALLEQTLASGARVPCHVHAEEDETLVVLEGAADIVLSGETRRISPGSAIYLPRGVRHGVKVVGERPCRMLHFIMPAGLEHFYREANRLPPGQRDDGAAIAELGAEYGIRFMR